MAQFTLQEVITAVNGLCQGCESVTFSTVVTDTRKIVAHSLFVALQGNNFDGHDFLIEAKKAGAIGAIVQKGKGIDDFLCIEVEDTLHAYQDLARFHRQRFSIPVIAITGSSGKTTTKEMLGAVLSSQFNVLKTEKNFNNEIGLPMTLLELTASHEVCIVEMGMRGLGQIEELASIAEPTIGIITNVGTSHIELLGSQEMIAQAKGELIRHLPSTGIAILNEDDVLVKSMSSDVKGKTITYGLEGTSTVRGSHISYKKDGIKFTCKCYDDVFDIFLPMIGVHNVYNALATIAVARVLGVATGKIKKSFSTFTGMAMRQEIIPLDDIVVLNDAYNANPSSMAESIKALGQLEGKRKIAMLGDMLELGNYTKEAHEAIGQLLADEGYDMVFTLGNASSFISRITDSLGIPSWHCLNHVDMANAYWPLHKKGDILLVKGSRGLAMEKVITHIQDKYRNNKVSYNE